MLTLSDALLTKVESFSAYEVSKLPKPLERGSASEVDASPDFPVSQPENGIGRLQPPDFLYLEAIFVKHHHLSERH